MRAAVIAVFAIGLGAMSVPALSQDMTDEELLQLFERQRDAFSAAKSSSTGKTRGLELVTLDDIAPPGDAPTGLGSPETDETGVSVTGSDGSVSVTEAPGLDDPQDAESLARIEPVVFGALDKDLQINVRIRFGFDSASLTPDQVPVLTQMCKVMKASDIQLFRIVGHTDSSGSPEYNERLSLLRAEEVIRYLVSDCGLAAERLEALGMGERFLFDETDPRGPENRRVEFQALS